MAIKKVCWFGFYDPIYSRNRVLLAGFRELGWEVVECRVDVKATGRLVKYWQLILNYWNYCFGIKFDLVIVAFPGHTVMPLAYLLFGPRIVFDAFVSLYNSEIEDRQKYPQHSLMAFYYFSLDRLASRLAYKILLDTNLHIDYFVKTFNLPASKFIRVFVGTTPDIFYPGESILDGSFIVHFHGSNIPLQGVSVVIEAARQLVISEPEIKFRLIGPFTNEKHVPANVELIAPVNLTCLNKLLAEADLVLGIFGHTPKSHLVIPNKVFEGLAVGKPVLTAETRAIKELLTDGRDIIFCRANDPVALAQVITLIKANYAIAKTIAEHGHKLFKSQLLPSKLVANLLAELNKDVT